MEPKEKLPRVRITAPELITRLKVDRARLLKGVDEKRLANVVKEVMSELAKTLATAQDSAVVVPGFGQFRVMKREVDKDGTKQTVDRIVFRAAKPAPANPERAAKMEEKKAAKKAAAPAKKTAKAPAA